MPDAGLLGVSVDALPVRLDGDLPGAIRARRRRDLPCGPGKLANDKMGMEKEGRLNFTKFKIRNLLISCGSHAERGPAESSGAGVANKHFDELVSSDISSSRRSSLSPSSRKHNPECERRTLKLEPQTRQSRLKLWEGFGGPFREGSGDPCTTMLISVKIPTLTVGLDSGAFKG